MQSCGSNVIDSQMSVCLCVCAALCTADNRLDGFVLSYGLDRVIDMLLHTVNWEYSD